MFKKLQTNTNETYKYSDMIFPLYGIIPEMKMKCNYTPNASAGFNGYTANEIRTAYNVPTVSGKPIIAVIIAYYCPNIQNDLNTYWKKNMTGNAPIINTVHFGTVQDPGWYMEACLDIQMIAIMNPNANIWLVQSADDTVTNILNAVNYATNTIKATVVSMSFGGNDSPKQSSLYSYFANSNVCYCASSGDANTPNFPSTYYNCISIGGTTLSSITPCLLYTSPSPRD